MLLVLKIIIFCICLFVGTYYTRKLNTEKRKNADLKTGIIAILIMAVGYLLFIATSLRETVIYCLGILLLVIVYLCIIQYRNKNHL